VLPVFGQGGVFTLGALSFAVAVLAVWLMGIETKGLALESLASLDVGDGAPVYDVAVDEAR
jgi:putative MFS transporter